MDNLLEINNLNYSYKDKIVLRDLQFSIKSSTTNLILGCNSCGKTTLIRLLCGILPSEGCITVDGITLTQNNLKQYLLSIGVVFFDDTHKFLFEKVIDELAFPLENLNYKKKDIINRIYEVRDLLDLQDCLNKKVQDLTYYEQVLVLIATSIMHNPKIIFLDNILSKLTEEEVTKLFFLLNKIKTNTSICVTSSNMRDVLYFDKVIVLQEGSTLLQGVPSDVLKEDNSLAKAGLILPPMIDLSIKLGFYELLDDIITDVDRMVDTLWK